MAVIGWVTGKKVELAEIAVHGRPRAKVARAPGAIFPGIEARISLMENNMTGREYFSIDGTGMSEGFSPNEAHDT